MRNLFIGILICSLSLPLFANEKHLFVIGGGGEDPGPNTIFDNSMEQLGTNAKAAGWKSTVYFDGGHSNTEKKVASAFGKNKITPFTQQSFDKFINEVRGQLSSGKIKPGEQVLLMINTHGYPLNEGQLIHSVSCGEKPCDLTKLKTLVKELEDAKVNVAVADLSCYSGSTLKNIGSWKTCVVSAGPNDDVGFVSFTDKFTSQFKSGNDIESMFLNSRTGSYNQAEINTEAGRQVAKLLAQYRSKIKTPLGLNTTQYKWRKTCDPKEFEQALTQQIESATGAEAGWMKEPPFRDHFAKLKASIEDYNATFLKAQELSRKISQIEKQPISPTNKTIPELLMANPETEIQLYEQLLKEAKKDKKSKDEIDYLQALLAEKRTLAKSIDSLGQVSAYQEWRGLNREMSRVASQDQESELFQKAFKVMDDEKKVYDFLYKKMQGSSSANRCRDFKI